MYGNDYYEDSEYFYENKYEIGKDELKKECKDHMDAILYELYEADDFDLERFEESLKEICKNLEVPFRTSALRRKVI